MKVVYLVYSSIPKLKSLSTRIPLNQYTRGPKIVVPTLTIVLRHSTAIL